MIISHKNKFIFIHVPKTGGTSIVRALYPFLDVENDIIIGGHPDHEDGKDHIKQSKGELHKHSTALEIKDAVGKETWDEYFIFAFVRNPFSRVVSMYEWWKQTVWKGESKKKKEISNMSYEEFTSSEYIGYSSLDFLTSKRTKKFHSEYSRTMQVDYIGRQEDMWRDFAYICGILNLPKITLEKHNVSKNKAPTYQEYYNSRSISNIQRLFREDLQEFNYHFDYEGLELEEEAKITDEVDDGAVDLNDLENLNDSNITEN
jgi:hypothetical protein